MIRYELLNVFLTIILTMYIYPESDGTAVSIARRMETCANKYAFKILKFR